MSPLRRAIRRLCELRANRAEGRKQAGSIAVLTLLAIGVLFGAFLYVAVIGSRVVEKARVQTAADATAMAAATIKARTMNYAAFLFLAESVVLPLGQVAWYITAAQVGANLPGVCGLLFAVGAEKDATECVEHLAGTAVTSKIKAREIGQWLDAIEQTAAALDEIGPIWAGTVAMQTGTAASYKPTAGTTGAVDLAAAYPLPLDSRCGGLGIQMVDNGQLIEPEGQSACRAESHWEQAYVLMGLDPRWSPLDLWAWLQVDPQTGCAWFAEGGASPLASACAALSAMPTIIQSQVASQLVADPYLGQLARGVLQGHALYAAQATAQGGDASESYAPSSGALPCHFQHKVPALSRTWKARQRSIGLAMISKPSEARMLAGLRSMKRTPASAATSSAPPGLLGIACAEHYAQDHVGSESLWHMDWRARLVPCQFGSGSLLGSQGGSDRALIEQCPNPADVLAARFTWQMGLGIGEDFAH